MQFRWNEEIKKSLLEWIKERRDYSKRKFGNTIRAFEYEKKIRRNIRIIILNLKHHQSQHTLAKKYGISESTVSNVLVSFQRFYITNKYKTTDTKRFIHAYRG